MATGLILSGGTAKTNLDLAVRAERAGFDSVFSVEFFNKHAYAVLGAIAHATERVRVGTAIANSFTRSPMLHASAAMDLDELSDGRMVLGLGSGTRRMNTDWYGVGFEKPAGRNRELVQVLRAVFAAQDGGGFRFEGEHYRLNIPAYNRICAARRDIPIWMAAVNAPMTRSAGAVADALVGHPIASRSWHREHTLPLLRQSEETSGRESGSCALKPYLLTVLDEDVRRARQDAKQQIGFYFTTRLYRPILAHHGMQGVAEACRAALRTMDAQAMAEAVPDALVDEIGIVCRPDEARDRLTQWQGLTDEPLLYAPTFGVPRERLLANLDAILDTFGE